MFCFKILSFVLLTGVIFLSTACAESKVNEMSVEAVKGYIQRNLRLGANYREVIKFLDKEKFEHSGYIKEEKKVFAIIREKKSNLIKKSIQLIFTFNDKKELIKIDIKESFTGP